MVQCKKCRLFVSTAKSDVIKCGGPCEGYFHKACIKDMNQFMENGACCLSCINKTPQKSPEFVDAETASNSMETLLKDLNMKLETMYRIEKSITDLAENVDFYAEQYQKMMEFQNECSDKMKKMNNKINDLEQKNVYLEKVNGAMEERMDLLEAKEYERKIEIIGLEEYKNENVKELASKIGICLGLPGGSINDIESAWRVGAPPGRGTPRRDAGPAGGSGGGEKPSPAAAPQPPKPRPIVVAMRSRACRDAWLKARKNKITNGAVYNNGKDKPIYIHENIPKKTRDLFWETKTGLKNFKYVWIQNLKVLIKESDIKPKIFQIKCQKDIRAHICPDLSVSASAATDT